MVSVFAVIASELAVTFSFVSAKAVLPSAIAPSNFVLVSLMVSVFAVIASELAVTFSFVSAKAVLPSAIAPSNFVLASSALFIAVTAKSPALWKVSPSNLPSIETPSYFGVYSTDGGVGGFIIGLPSASYTGCPLTSACVGGVPGLIISSLQKNGLHPLTTGVSSCGGCGTSILSEDKAALENPRHAITANEILLSFMKTPRIYLDILHNVESNYTHDKIKIYKLILMQHKNLFTTI